MPPTLFATSQAHSKSKGRDTSRGGGAESAGGGVDDIVQRDHPESSTTARICITWPNNYDVIHPTTAAVTPLDTRFTWLFVSTSHPLTTRPSARLPSCNTTPRSVEYRVRCTVAPSTESTRLPNPPANPPHPTSSPITLPEHAPFSNTMHTPITSPITAPPATEHAVPHTVIPPFVPAGTSLSVVTSPPKMPQHSIHQSPTPPIHRTPPLPIVFPPATHLKPHALQHERLDTPPHVDRIPQSHRRHCPAAVAQHLPSTAVPPVHIPLLKPYLALLAV
ncbi:hypothetical protein D9615_007624 [Tricholomella constricta]|uniref:Uncharacterized protein n=1 Tax=Tricholomella constricta TaxID=117010 RepID=A0A8H5M2B9_9AGAR|nr:hypothetical protein D9615_007624 [Tricholomella constricta]